MTVWDTVLHPQVLDICLKRPFIASPANLLARCAAAGAPQGLAYFGILFVAAGYCLRRAESRMRIMLVRVAYLCGLRPRGV